MSTGTGSTWMDRLAHDLRGPLAPMLTAVHLLRDGGTTDAQRQELLEMLQRQVLRLGGMIDEFDDYGRAEAGRLVGRRDTIDLELLVADVAARMHARPPALAFDADLQGATIEGDTFRIAQLFQVLLGFRLTRSDTTPLHVRVERDGGDMRMTCRLACAGASDALVEALLTSPHPDPPDDALGLGTMIASAIASAHGGRLHGRHPGGDAIELVLELPLSAPAPLPRHDAGS